MAGILAKNPNRAAVLMQLQHLFGKFPDKARVLEATRHVAGRYSELPEARYAVGVAALLAERTALANAEVDAALELRAGWEQGAILKEQVAQDRSGEGDRLYEDIRRSQSARAGSAHAAGARARRRAPGSPRPPR